MNLILLYPTDFTTGQQVTLTDRRYTHIQKVHKAQPGQQLIVGLLNGKTGHGIVTSIDNTQVTLDITLEAAPPVPLPLTLIIALPRPQMLKRILQTCATMGVKKIIFLHSQRVEKSYWQTPALNPEAIHEQLILGLEQGKDTVLPEVVLEKRFKPFVEEQLPELCKQSLGLVAHPQPKTPTHPLDSHTPITLVIGPEGGFIDYEIEKLVDAGCNILSLGPRILRVETAVTALLAKLFF